VSAGKFTVYQAKTDAPFSVIRQFLTFLLVQQTNPILFRYPLFAPTGIWPDHTVTDLLHQEVIFSFSGVFSYNCGKNSEFRLIGGPLQPTIETS